LRAIPYSTPAAYTPRLSNIKVVTIFLGSKNGKYRINIWVVTEKRDKKIADKAIKILGRDVQLPSKKYYVFRISNLARIVEYTCRQLWVLLYAGISRIESIIF
jgi:hypothetical protein